MINIDCYCKNTLERTWVPFLFLFISPIYPEKHRATGKLLRKDTSMKLDDTEEAIRKFEKNRSKIREEEEDDDGKKSGQSMINQLIL